MRRPSVQTALAVLGLAGLLAAPAAAQDQELRDEIRALKQGQEQIQKQLEELKRLVQARPAAAAAPSGPNVSGVVFDLGDNPVKGPDSAKLTLVEFTDYQ